MLRICTRVAVISGILAFGYYWFTNLFTFLEFRFAYSISAWNSSTDPVIALGIGDVFGTLRILVYPVGVFLALYYAEVRWEIDVPSKYHQLILSILGGGLMGFGVSYVPVAMLGGAFGVLGGPLEVVFALISTLINLATFGVSFAFLGFAAVALAHLGMQE
jgi:hypothetical protein